MWLFGNVFDHVEICGSKAAEGLSAFNVDLVYWMNSVSSNRMVIIGYWDRSLQLLFWKSIYSDKNVIAQYLSLSLDVEVGFILNNLPQVPHICVNESGQHWFR